MNSKNYKKNKPEVMEKVKKKHYSLVTFVLIICIVELAVSCATNIKKNIHFASKIKRLESKHNQELIKNEQLKSQIKNFDSEAILESITRNNLKMAGENEILVIIHQPKEKNMQTENDDNISKK